MKESEIEKIPYGALLEKATPLLEEKGENGLPDYGAYATFDDDDNPIVHHSQNWKAGR